MTKLAKISFVCLFIGTVSGCSQILQPVELEINSRDSSIQEEFSVVEKTLTIAEAKKQNISPYNRLILQAGRGNNAKPISEILATKSNLPSINRPSKYKIGIGDTLTFSRLIENNRTQIENEINWPKNRTSFKYTLGVGDHLALTLLKEETKLSFAPGVDGEDQRLVTETQNDIVLKTEGRIGSDGSVLLLEIGRLEAKGKTLNELQSEVRNILIRNGASPRFQLEIIDFKSQKVYLTIEGASIIRMLDDQQTTLRDILTSANVGFKSGTVTRVRLLRNGTEFLMQLSDIFYRGAPNIVIYNNDHIFIEESPTKDTERFYCGSQRPCSF